MKKTALFIIVIFLLFASCGKDSDKEWSRFYGFTQADVVGHYEANPDESLYEPLPVEGVAVYDNATIDVSAEGSVNLSIHVVIPGKGSATISGPIDMSDDNRSDIILTNVINPTNKEDIMMTVYKNESGQVRFHGRVKRYYYKYNDHHELVLTRSDNWGFDVIKDDN